MLVISEIIRSMNNLWFEENYIIFLALFFINMFFILKKIIISGHTIEKSYNKSWNGSDVTEVSNHNYTYIYKHRPPQHDDGQTDVYGSVQNVTSHAMTWKHVYVYNDEKLKFKWHL